MRYFCVRGDPSFPFYIPKITSRNARLLKDYTAQKQSFLADAENNLHAVQAACARLAKEFHTEYSTEICLQSNTVRVNVFLPLWNLRCKDWELLQQLSPYLIGISAQPFAFGLKILFKVKYFPRQASSVEKDLQEILEKYTDN